MRDFADEESKVNKIVSAVRVALKTDTDTAVALVELNSYLMETAAYSREVLRSVISGCGFRHVVTPTDWEHTKKFCCQHKSGVFVLEYVDRLIVIADGEICDGEATAEKPCRVWYRSCGEK